MCSGIVIKINLMSEKIRFDSLPLSEGIQAAVKEMGFEFASPIQSEAIPYVLEGRDVIGQAQTGTGKTAAFGIPMIEHIVPFEKFVQAIILCPTRELAVQVSEELRFMEVIRLIAKLNP